MSETENSKKFMRRAIELAKLGEGKTNPNPLVGAVIVRDGRIIGEGYHHKYGELHAERDALKNCYQNGENPNGATIFVTLEPCCHFGKQPPCTQALVEAGISRVIVGSRDPNPLVHGKGNVFLREHGVSVEEDFLKEECDALNSIFFYYIQTKMPYVALKFAMTLDGKIATKTGASKWISCEKSREFAHVLRNRYAAILAGIGTVLADDPVLNCRLTNEKGEKIGQDPIRVICDSNLRIPLESKIVKTADEIQSIVACVRRERGSEEKFLFDEKKFALEKAGVEVIEISGEKESAGNISKIFDSNEIPNFSENENFTHRRENPKPSIDLYELMKILGEKKIDSVLVEGGGAINYSALESKIVSKIYAFVSPKIFGGVGKSPVGGEGVNFVEESFKFNLEKITRFDEDILLEYRKF